MRSFFPIIAAALLFVSCGGNNNGGNSTTPKSTDSSATKQVTNAAPQATSVPQPEKNSEPNIYVAASTFTNDKDKKTTIYKNGETLYTYDGMISFLYVVGGHVYYGINPIDEEESCKVYADGKDTKIVLGPDRRVWKGDKDVFFDDCTGKVFDQTEKTVFTYTLSVPMKEWR